MCSRAPAAATMRSASLSSSRPWRSSATSRRTASSSPTPDSISATRRSRRWRRPSTSTTPGSTSSPSTRGSTRCGPMRVSCRSSSATGCRPRWKRMANVGERMNPAEWEQRVNLAACYRLVAMYGWADLIFTHISARVPGPEHHFLINPYGMLFDEITASSLVKVDLHGRKVLDSAYDINPAGFVIHSAVHEARDDANCVLHVHSVNGVAISAQEDGVLPLSQHSIFVLSSLGYHDYEGVALNEDEKPRLVRDLGEKNFLMLRNHGLLTCGPTVAEAFLYMYILQK